MKPWDNVKYQRIVAAHVEQGVLFVRFANNEEATVLLRNVSPKIDASKAHDVTNDHIRINGHEVKILFEGETLVIPWDNIRFQTDHLFARHMLELAQQQAAEVGGIIRIMRAERSMTMEDLALRTDLSLTTIKNIELGDRDVSFSNLRKILGAMGFSLRDIAEMYHKEKQ